MTLATGASGTRRPEELERTALGRAARRRRWTSGRWWVLFFVGLVLWSLWGSGVGRVDTVNPGGWSTMRAFWVAAAHPDLSGDYLRKTASATVTTLSFALLGTVLAVFIGLIGGALISETWWRTPAQTSRARRAGARLGWYLGRLTLGMPRGVHEAVWGLFFVSVLGRDPLVGVLALGIPFGAITAKVFAELTDETAGRQHAALADAGVGRLTALLYAVLPRTWPDLVSYAFYRFDCSIRSAVILGMIGAGGLGFELSLTFQALAYQQMWTLIYALVVVGAVVDRWGASLRGTGSSRRRLRRSVVLGVVLTAAAAVHLGPDLERVVSARTWQLLGELARSALPPRPPTGWAELARQAATTLQISVLAIALGGALGVVTAFVAARDGTHGPRAAVAALARLLLLVTRAVSPPVWALVVLFVLFPGSLPGAVALGLYNYGVLGRLFAEVVENLGRGPESALLAAGARRGSAFLYGVLPLAATRFAGYGLYRWEVAIRESVVVGVVGAGGLGRLLEERRAAFDYPGMLAVVIALMALSLLVDLLSSSARRAWR